MPQHLKVDGLAYKALTLNNFQPLAELEDRLLDCQEHSEQVAKPFEWKFPVAIYAGCPPSSMVARKTTAWLHNGRRGYVIELAGQSTKARDEYI